MNADGTKLRRTQGLINKSIVQVFLALYHTFTLCFVQSFASTIVAIGLDGYHLKPKRLLP